MNPLEVGGHIDGNVAIDGHADNDVHAPSHKAIQKGDHQMGLPDKREKEKAVRLASHWLLVLL